MLKKAQMNHIHGQDGKREQSFEKINILLLRNKSWREKVSLYTLIFIFVEVFYILGWNHVFSVTFVGCSVACSFE